MRAAVLVAEDDPEAMPPPDLMLLWQVRNFNALPEAGGLRDQPAGWLQRATLLDNLHRVWAASLDSQTDLAGLLKQSATAQLYDMAVALAFDGKLPEPQPLDAQLAEIIGGRWPWRIIA